MKKPSWTYHAAASDETDAQPARTTSPTTPPPAPEDVANGEGAFSAFGTMKLQRLESREADGPSDSAAFASTTAGSDAPSSEGDESDDAAIEPADEPSLFLNRELSWLEFNRRVLNEAKDASVPLSERLKFLAITASNLDEFFMVRVAGLVEQEADHIQKVTADGMTPSEQLSAIADRSRTMVQDAYDTLVEQILPELAEAGVRIVDPAHMSEADRKEVEAYFRNDVLPILTPLAIDPGHPFPHVRNKSLNIVAVLSAGPQSDRHAFAVVQVPGVLPRLSRISSGPGERANYVLLEDVIASNLGILFPGFNLVGAWPFRVIRNSDLEVDEEEAEDLLESVRSEIRRRDRGRAVLLTVTSQARASAVQLLEDSLELTPEFVHHADGPLDIPGLLAMTKPLEDQKRLKDPPFHPETLPPFRDDDDSEDIFEVIREQDVLLHHPFESFDPVVAFVEAAATDPSVLAIKQTVYRTSGDSPIVKSLMRAAELGKQVTALVEIKARFDEENNIQWARTLENAGVHVVYGLLGLKTHCKMSLVVRREGARLKRYVHFGTGNYNPTTARLYTDVSFFTARQDLGEDATGLFNLLTSCTAPASWNKLTVAPLGLHERILALIEREASFARAGRSASIVAKMNSLVDPDVIMALYRASQAGVEIDLIVRGICCLRSGLPGVSDRIRVRSIVDRFLEHSRIFFFEAGGAREVYASSADWMPRNFQRRVEVMFPIEQEDLKARVVDEILGIQLADTRKARLQKPDGSYEAIVPVVGDVPFRSQEEFLRLAREGRKEADAQERANRPFIVRPVRIRPTAATSKGTDTETPSDSGSSTKGR